MSFFYLLAVKGEIPVHLLELAVTSRLDYLKNLLNGSPPIYNEYVVEGSLYDNVSHFMVCVIAILSESSSFSQFVLRAEVELFKRRLESLTAYELRCFAKKLVRSIRKHEDAPIHFDAILSVSNHLILKDLSQHICLATHNSNCMKHAIKLSFKHCFEFISRREVELQYGMAIVPCGKWKNYLTLLFRKNLKLRIDKTDLETLRSDPRVIDLLVKIRKSYFPSSEISQHKLSSSQVDGVSKRFPPCMLNLHKTLRKKHRLSHDQRFKYSLFLKDIGLPIEEAIDFWRFEYRQAPSGQHACCHHWEKDEKKYLYGIRHMYGLEGCRKNYTSVNCQHVQSQNSCSEGGCPFKSFDDTSMTRLLDSPSPHLLNKINEFRDQKKFTQCCILYLNDNEQINCDNFSFNFTPVKFYRIATKMNSSK